MEKICTGPVQVPVEGVTIITPTIGIELRLVPVNDGIVPVPDAPRPMLVLLFVQA